MSTPAPLAETGQERPVDPGARPADGAHGSDHDEHALDALTIARIMAVALAAAVVAGWGGPPARLLGLGALILGGWPIYREALANLLARRMTMELSMSIAIAAAAAISALFTALLITLFVLVAEVLEGMTVARGRRAIHDLLERLPAAVSARRGGVVTEVAASALAIGDAVLVNPGGRIPVDGTVIAGHSFVDEARITGESLPVEKTAGAQVLAGSLNQSGVLEIRAQRLGRDTSYGKIIDAVEQAERSRAPVQRLADRLAGHLVYFALGAALLTLILTRDLHATIAVVIVAGACGIAAGTPLAILGAIGCAARSGAIIKGGRCLEQLGRIDTVVLDKTGTLTWGRPGVRALTPVKAGGEWELLDAAACAEARSEHPIGQAIVAHARALGRRVCEPQEVRYTPGRGIAATVSGRHLLVGNGALMREHGIEVPAHLLGQHPDASEVLVARDETLLGLVVIADTVRPEAARAIRRLRELAIEPLLMSGDALAVARAIGHPLGIQSIAAPLLPEDKRQRVQALVASGRTVAMVGDGINDAPALMAAQVGVAMGSGTDVARESADIVLLANDLMTFAQTVSLARRTRRIIWFNFAGTLGVDALGIVLAAAGCLSPLLAAFIHVASELAFILNSARLLPRGSAAQAD